MEAFILAIGLRMGWPAVADANAQLDEPDRQLRDAVGRFRGAPPEGTVVGVDAQGHAIAAEHVFQRRLYLRPIGPRTAVKVML